MFVVGENLTVVMMIEPLYSVIASFQLMFLLLAVFSFIQGVSRIVLQEQTVITLFLISAIPLFLLYIVNFILFYVSYKNYGP